MPDITNFWTGFKFSWFRRLLETEAFWPKILLHEVSKITNEDMESCDLLRQGAARINDISKNITNMFWKQVLSSTVPMVAGFIFSQPEKLTFVPFWSNPLIVRNRVIKYRDYPEIVGKVEMVGDFFYAGSNQLMSYDDFIERYNCFISLEKYIDIRYIITRTLQILKLPQSRLCHAQHPLKPTLIDIATSIKKGCSIYYKLLNKKAILNNKLYLREAKWHNELGTVFSLNFWNQARILCSKIDFDNQLKWLQFQIVRNSLQTNYIVNHFKPNVPKFCTFCQNLDSNELISHIFWLCPIIAQFISEIVAFINNQDIEFNPTKTEFLFGYKNVHTYSIKNFIPLVLKKYIWRSKFKTATVTLVGFKAQLKSYLIDLKYMFDFKNVSNLFDEWNTLFEAL